MKVTKTYGINGLLEWHGTVTSGSVRMKVDFTNGSVSAFGVAPASFITSDAVTQHIIENSDQFKSGRIRLVGRIESPGEQPRKSSIPTPSSPSSSPADTIGEEITETDMQVVEVSCLDDARDYLSEHYGVAKRDLRSKSAIITAAKDNGVKLVIAG